MDEQDRCPESGADHEYDAGECLYCGRPDDREPTHERAEDAPDTRPRMTVDDCVASGQHSLFLRSGTYHEHITVHDHPTWAHEYAYGPCMLKG